MNITEHADYVQLDLLSNGQALVVRCKEVVIAAGALETVRLLRNSRLVKKIAFPLGFHPMVRALGEHSKAVNDDGHFPPYQSWDKGNEFKLGFSVSTFSYLQATYTALTGNPVGAEKLPRLLAYFASFTLKSSRAFTVILAKRAFNWIFWGVADRRRLNQGQSLLADVLLAGGAREVVISNRKPTVSTVHLFGTIPLGKSKLVDGKGKVLGTSRVFICDSSLLPVAPWVNPQGPIMVLCELVTSRKLGY